MRWESKEHHRLSYCDILMWQYCEGAVEIKILWCEKKKVGSRASIIFIFGLLVVTNVQMELGKSTFM